MQELAERVKGSRAGLAALWAGGIVLALLVGHHLVLPNGAPLGVILQGVVFGTVTALLGMGLILIYRVNHIINFAYASMGGVGGVLAVQLFLEADWPYLMAGAAGLAVGLLVGGLVEVLVIRRFANASRLILTVATIGLAQILGGIELLIPRGFGSAGIIGGFETPFSGGFNVGAVRFTGDHLLIIGSVPLVVAALAWFLLKTDAGVAVRAAAENRDRALTLGIPIHRLTTIVWVIAGGLAALTAILKAPFAGSVSTALSGPTLLLPAIAAAVIARMYSLPTAFVAGIGLGILEQLAFWNTGTASSIDVAFLVVILVALLFQKGKISRAEDTGAATWSMAEAVRRVPTELRRLPEIRIARAGGLLVLLGLALYLPHTWGIQGLNLVTVAMIWGLVAVSLAVLTGWSGQVSLGQFAIVGVGGIVAGNLLVRYNVDLFVVLVLAGAAGALTALLIGLPALRIRGLFLAATTLAFAVALDSYFLNPTNFPNIVQGRINRPSLWGRFDLDERLVMYYFTLAILVVAILVSRSIRQARAGRVLFAVRDNERAAAAAAVPTTTAKLSAFLFSGVIAGIAGALYVLQIRGAGVGTFGPSMSLEVFSMAVIGGIGSIAGTLIGVGLFRYLAQALSGELRLIVTGAGLLFVLMIIPGGIAQTLFGLRDRALRWVAHRRGILVPSLVEDRLAEETVDEAPDEAALVAGALSGEDDSKTKEPTTHD